MQSVTQITEHLADIRERVERAAGGDRSRVMIVAVSKQQSADAIREAYEAGQRHFGENYLQEALGKMAALGDLDLEWHFVGHLQANKTRAIAERFDWVHTVDRDRIAVRLNDARPYHAAPLNVLIQVNQAGEPQKAGIDEALTAELAHTILRLPRLQLRGLMTVPPLSTDPERTAVSFTRLRDLQARLGASGVATDTLSMGMSADFEIAIACGSNCVRIGTAIFGPRR
jgi:hypothetical protein